MKPYAEELRDLLTKAKRMAIKNNRGDVADGIFDALKALDSEDEED